MIKALIASLLICACTTVETAPTPTSTDVTWTVYTHAECDGVTVNEAHSLCALPSPQDVQEPGDADVTDWVNAWLADCQATQGLMGTPGQGHFCVDASGQPAPSRCSVDVQPTFETCQ